MPNFSSFFPGSFARGIPVVAAFLLALPACAADPRVVGVAPPTRIPDAPETPLNTPIERIPTASVPAEIRRRVVADAAAHLKVAPSSIVLSRAERVNWSDGSLGCRRTSDDGETLFGVTQIVENGYRIVAKTSSRELVYHSNGRTDQAATVIRCDPPVR
jgi:hypothetical protein